MTTWHSLSLCSVNRSPLSLADTYVDRPRMPIVEAIKAFASCLLFKDASAPAQRMSVWMFLWRLRDRTFQAEENSKSV